MKHEIYLDFVIADFEDITHDEISDMLGLKPRKVYLKGAKKNPNSESNAVFKRNRWIVSSSIAKDLTFEDHINTMLDLLEPKIELLKPLCDKYSCCFLCAVKIDSDDTVSTPSIYL